VWTDTPTSISVVHNSTLPTGASPFDVTVTAGGPLEGATVCLWKDTEVYMVDQTNASGVASFTPDPSTTGTMYVTVTKHNYIPYEGAATVETGGDTQDPDVTVVQPNGGETWHIDSFFDITWNATDNVGVTSVDILLSTDGGGTYPHTIAAAEPNDGVYPWLVDVSPTTEARVKVVAFDAAMNSGEDESDANFEIADGTAPSVTVTQPNGGETWHIDSFFDITWTATDNIGVTSISIVLSSDAGATFDDTLATGEVNDGIFPWLVTSPAAAAARIKVIAYDGSGNGGEDISDGDFEIYDPLSGISVDGDIPSQLVITANMPNPFCGRTTIKFGVPRDGRVNMAVYDVAGRLVTSLVEGSHTAGYHTVEWSDDGNVGTGVYFLKLRLGRDEVTRKVVISR
jgi:hypothetical protein